MLYALAQAAGLTDLQRASSFNYLYAKVSDIDDDSEIAELACHLSSSNCRVARLAAVEIDVNAG